MDARIRQLYEKVVSEVNEKSPVEVNRKNALLASLGKLWCNVIFGELFPSFSGFGTLTQNRFNSALCSL